MLMLFTEAGLPIILGQSFDQNMGLSGQRIGCLSLVSRSLWSCPPVHGARIAETILKNPKIYQLWLKEVRLMAQRIQNMRYSFTKALKELGSPHDQSYLSKQFGLYSFNKNEGISIAGLNDNYIKYVAMAFHEVTKNTQI
ncbi:unnamed protein product [Paramecium primaurelia]|uniref:Aminotransferase class I/classII large domain-containing protein n=1 Tax=Paramecium primaurelia TaxID=5886 RepID=A0A8S1L4P0_PARPR|nr:unnamed protein product [Paramecium primaurelia]